MSESIPPVEHIPEPSSKIRLEFLRHAEKTGTDRVDPLDKQISLTKHGREQSVQKGLEFEMSHPVAVGSNRDRTQETALYAVGAHQWDITRDESLDELKDKIDQELAYGSRLLVDSRLDMPFTKGTPLHIMLEGAYNDGVYFKTLIKMHDDLMEAAGEDHESVYAIQARNIAQIIEKYIHIAPTWNKLVEENQGHYSTTLERILSTHGSVGESFLAEYLDKTKGRAERDRFLALFPNGFDYVQGFGVEIITLPGEEAKVHLKVSVESKNGEIYALDEIAAREVIDEIAGVSEQ